MLNRLLITGAAGGLGRVMRLRLAPMAKTLRLSDIVDLGVAAAHEELMTCDLGDEQAVYDLVADCDGIVHFGGISTENTFSRILNANIQGVYHLYEAARAQGMPRIVFASSNHAIGYYRQDQFIDNQVPTRPDSLYGVSKVFGEGLASMYYDKFGQETAIVRIGSCFPEPLNHRMLATWLSADDFVALIERVFTVPRLGCPVIYGMSDNDTVWWDNRNVSYLGWQPKDNAEAFRAKLDATLPKPVKDAPDMVYQGGMFTADPIFKD